MMSPRYLLLSVLLIGYSFRSAAQNVNGNWYGIGQVQVTGETNHYMGELQLKQKGKAVTGTLSYYFKDSLFQTKVTGSFDAPSRKLTINPVTIIFHASASTQNGIDCIMTGDFLLRTSKTESLLTGAFLSDEAHKYTVPNINFRFRYSTDTVPLVLAKEQPEEEAETVAAITPVSIEKTDIKAANIDSTSPFFRRNKVYVKEIEVVSDVLKLELYDNGEIDYDSVSLYLNDGLILPKTKLDHRAIRMSINLDKTKDFNEVSMYAENLGMIPPNTAALILYDGNKRYEVILTSDMDKTATIKLVRKKQ